MTRHMWVEHVENPKTITSIFPQEPPCLEGVQLRYVTITCGEDLQCTLCVNLAHFPAPAPAKWVQQQCNTVQLTLTLVQATIHQCAIPGGDGQGDLTIEFTDSRFSVVFTTQHQVLFSAAATWIQINSISAYQQELE